MMRNNSANGHIGWARERGNNTVRYGNRIHGIPHTAANANVDIRIDNKAQMPYTCHGMSAGSPL